MVFKEYLHDKAGEQEAKRGAESNQYLKVLQHDTASVEQLAADGELKQMQAASLLQELDERIDGQLRSKCARKRKSGQVNTRLFKETGLASWWKKGKQAITCETVAEMCNPTNDV